MTDLNSQPQITPNQPALVPAKRSFFRSKWFIGGAIILTGIVGFGLGKISHFRHHGGWGYMMSDRGMGSSFMQTRAEYGINRLLSSVDATVEQKTRITAVAQRTIAEMQSLRQVRREVRDKLATALKAPQVDRAGIEELRTKQLQLAESMSKKMQDSLLEAAEILNPTQRAALVDRWQARRWRG
jgi:Spy/CpxP family protein refolding chaperone